MKKAIPTLPGASRMRMAGSSGNSVSKIKGGSGPVSKKVVNGAKGKGMKGSNPYCD